MEVKLCGIIQTRNSPLCRDARCLQNSTLELFARNKMTVHFPGVIRQNTKCGGAKLVKDNMQQVQMSNGLWIALEIIQMH